MMDVVSANQAKTQFGDMLLKAQREPVKINKHGKPVAVLMSAEEYEDIEALKLQLLKNRALSALSAAEQDNLTEGNHFFDDLEVGSFDK